METVIPMIAEMSVMTKLGVFSNMVCADSLDDVSDTFEQMV